MSLFSKIFLAFGAFLIVSSAVYAVHAGDYMGLTLSLSVAGGALLVGFVVAAMVMRTRTYLVMRPPTPGSAADDEAHVPPTIWPFVYALSSIALVIGAVITPWALVVGGVLFVVASVGWAVDVRRQWRHHHAAGAAAHGEPEH